MLLLWSLALGRISVSFSCGWSKSPSTNVFVGGNLLKYTVHFSLNVIYQHKHNICSFPCEPELCSHLSIISLFGSVYKICLCARVDLLQGESFPLEHMKWFFYQLKPPALRLPSSPHPPPALNSLSSIFNPSFSSPIHAPHYYNPQPALPIASTPVPSIPSLWPARLRPKSYLCSCSDFHSAWTNQIIMCRG